MKGRNKRSESTSTALIQSVLKEAKGSIINTQRNCATKALENTKIPGKEIHHRRLASQRPALDYDSLITACTTKLELNSNHKKALFLRASTYMKKGLYKMPLKIAMLFFLWIL